MSCAGQYSIHIHNRRFIALGWGQFVITGVFIGIRNPNLFGYPVLFQKYTKLITFLFCQVYIDE
jgi:hypothetical protein